MSNQQPLLTSTNKFENTQIDPSKMSQSKEAEPRSFQLFSSHENPNKYPQNLIITSRYTLLSFIPKSMFEQFRRLANVYFLVIGTIAVIGQYSGYYEPAVQFEGVLLPMMIVVLISMTKEGVEDIKRHSTDVKTNSRKARKIESNGSVVEIEWREIQVGMMILLFGDDEVPADIISLACGGVQGPTCYVETAAIDGETNLKIRLPCLTNPQLKALRSQPITNANDPLISLSGDRMKISGLSEFSRISLEVEPPNESIHRFNGSCEVHNNNNNTSGGVYSPMSEVGSPTSPSPSNEDQERLIATLSEKNLLLRGSLLKATEWCVGTVVYTGKDTKLSLNSKQPPSKLSTVDRIVNKTLVIAISCMILVCIISMLLEITWQNNNKNADYLCLRQDSLNDVYVDGGGCMSAATASVLTILTFATLYNNFVCISMYVSLEMVYLCQSFYLSSDLTLYDQATDTPAECHSSGMCADLGQIQFILSDKTGTLTKNIMKLRRCSVVGKIFGGPILMPQVGDLRSSSVIAKSNSSSSSLMGSLNQNSFDEALSQSTDFKTHKHLPLQDGGSNPSYSQDGATTSPFDLESNSKEHEDEDDFTGRPTLVEETESWHPLRQMHPLAPLLSSHAESEKDIMRYFLLVLSVCNTVMLMPDAHGQVNVTDHKSLLSHLQAESPDEVALVLAAAEHSSVILNHRNPTEIGYFGLKKHHSPTFNPSSDCETMELLGVNEFDSDRKRMSILVRMDNGKGGLHYVLLCKGADNSMLANCISGKFTSSVLDHVDNFAKTGLRTLVLARRILSDEEATRWLKTYNTARSSIVGRTEQLFKCALEIEVNMELLGAVGVEDELQDGCPEAIMMLRQAGLNVWMITGDKAETAMAIGKMCGLLSNNQHVEKVINITGEVLAARIYELHKFITATKTKDEYLQSVQSKASSAHTGPFSWLFGGQNTDLLSPLQQPERVSMGGAKSHVRMQDVALVIDGIALEGIWADNSLKNLFATVIQSIPTVIACRVSPLQKASLVHMIKTSPGNPITLAIGDGANDVSMINEARVGVGINGKEGRHAANSADFAISQFQFLVPLLMEHGRFNYIRCSKLVLYSFFKNLLLVSTLFYYCIYSGVSGTISIDSIVFSGYNFYLGLPVVALGAFDYDIPRSSVYVYPAIAYATGRLGEMLNIRNMARWCVFAFLQGMILFSVVLRILSRQDHTTSIKNINVDGTGLQLNLSGRSGGIYVEGFLLFTTTVIAMQVKIMTMTQTPNWISWASVIVSMMGYFAFTYLYSVFPGLDFYQVMPLTFEMANFWLSILSVPVLLYLSDWFVEAFFQTFFPTHQDRLIQQLEIDARKKELLPETPSINNNQKAGLLPNKQKSSVQSLSSSPSSSSPTHSTTHHPQSDSSNIDPKKLQKQSLLPPSSISSSSSITSSSPSLSSSSSSPVRKIASISEQTEQVVTGMEMETLHSH